MKDSQFRIRVDEHLRQSFIDTCRDLDRPASQVLREFMKQFVEEQGNGTQTDLFRPSSQGEKE